MDPRSVSRASQQTSTARRTEVGRQEDFVWPPSAEDLASFSVIAVDENTDPHDAARLIVAGMRGSTAPKPEARSVPQAPAAPPVRAAARPVPASVPRTLRITVTRPEPRPPVGLGPIASAGLAFVFVSCMALVSYAQLKSAQRPVPPPAPAPVATAPAASPSLDAPRVEPTRVRPAKTTVAPEHAAASVPSL
jgi:hypothetical protein